MPKCIDNRQSVRHRVRSPPQLHVAVSPGPGFHDEMMTAAGEVRPHWQGLVDLLNRIGPEG